MKTPPEVLADVERRLSRTWAHELLADVDGGAGAWPHDFPLSAPRGEVLDQTTELFAWARDWNTWAGSRAADVVLRRETRIYRTTRQQVPTHLTVPTLDGAAKIVGAGWNARLQLARGRLTGLRDHRRDTDIDVTTLKLVCAYSDADFMLLLKSVDWFAANPHSAFTPRQVPIAGLHTKWLDSSGRRDLICRLAGLDGLGLNEQRPHPVNFTYLDRTHRAHGGRVHDSIVPGDRAAPIYEPAIVLICENRDSAVFFPELDSAIAIQGAGNEGPARVSELLDTGWLPRAARLVYWGDLDAQGFEIVNAYRERGVPVETILMDIDTLRAYADYGVNISSTGKPLGSIQRRPLTRLTPGELEAYEAVTDDGPYPARLEQERIPLSVALSMIND